MGEFVCPLGSSSLAAQLADDLAQGQALSAAIVANLEEMANGE